VIPARRVRVLPDSPRGNDSFAFVCHPYHRGGVTRWMVDAAVEWARRGGRSYFVCPRPGYPFLSAGSQPPVMNLVDEEDPRRTVTRVSDVVGVRYELGTERYRASVILGLIRSSVPSGSALVLSDEPAVWRAASALAADYPVVGVLHADDEHYYGLAEAYGSRLSALVGVSARIVAQARRRLRLEPARVHRIPCGIRLPEPAVRSTNGDAARLIWVGRIEERQKRVSDLPAILRAICQLQTEATLDIVGDGPDIRRLHAAVTTAGVSSAVRWHGWRSAREVRERLANTDVLLLPSNFEGMPVAVMEALAAGCGVVASSVSGLEDYATHSLAASCFRTHTVGDVAGAAVAALELMAVPVRQRLRSARALAESEFSIERCLDHYAELPVDLTHARAVPRRSLAWSRIAAAASLPVSVLRQARVSLGGITSRRSQGNFA
jgi:glycosyltransferase involved in cell wall biosynthesis